MKKIICTIMVIAFVFCFYACGTDSVTVSDNTIPLETTTKQAAQKISLQLLNGYLNTNIIEAKDKYQGSFCTFDIMVTEIHSSYIKATVYESNALGYFAFHDVSISLTSSEIKPLRVGDEITVEGYISIFEAIAGGNGFKIIDANVVEE